MITIAIDAMGGDFGPSVTVPAACDFISQYPDAHLILVGDKILLQQALRPLFFDKNRLSIQHASERVEMDELPSQALRNKKDSSMRVAINLVKAGKAQACVSAGNTGALMATARFVLKTLSGIDRPAIISTFPTFKARKNMRMLDLGANVDSSPESLMQFAVMGSVLTSAIDCIPNPSVYLLNIGEEEMKGNEQVKKTARLLAQIKSINYAGFIEGDAIFEGEADIVVCDGFVGNVTLKTTEGVALFITKLLKKSFTRNLLTKLLGLLLKPILKSFIKEIDPAQFNGATFIGLKETVVKSHGSANRDSFKHAIYEAMLGVEKNIPERIQHEVESIIKLSFPQTPH